MGGQKYVYVAGEGVVTRYKEHLTLSFLVVAFLCVTLGNLLSSLGLIQLRRLDELLPLLPSSSAVV